MANKPVVAVLCSCALFPLLSMAAGASHNIGELSSAQQNALMLKVAIERAKLERELNELNEVKGVSSEVCSQKGVGALSLYAVYGVNKRRFATFSYNSTTQVDAGIGDTLLCGEIVKSINLDKVKVEKAGKIYTVSGTVTAVPSVPLQTISPTLFR